MQTFDPVASHFSCASLQKEPPFAEVFFFFSCKEKSNSVLVSKLLLYSKSHSPETSGEPKKMQLGEETMEQIKKRIAGIY